MKQSQFILILAAILFLNSCSKSGENAPGPSPSPSPSGTSTILARVYEIDTTQPAPRDTMTRWYFTYDNLNRVILDSSANTSLNPGSVYSIVKKIYYQGADVLASRKIETGFNGVTVLSADTTYYTYINGIRASDSSVYVYAINPMLGIFTSKYTYLPGQLIRKYQLRNPPAGADSGVNYMSLTTVNNSATFQKDSSFYYLGGIPQAPTIYSITTSYLPNPNPFYSVMSAYSQGFYSRLGIGNYATCNYAPQNLIARQTTSKQDGLSYDYTFRADGYPVIARVTTSSVNGSYKTKLLFIYK